MKLVKNNGIKTKFFFENEKTDVFDNKYGTFKLITNKDKTLYVGLGKKKDITSEKIRKIGANIYNYLKMEGKDLTVDSQGKLSSEENYFLMEGFILATYEFNKYLHYKVFGYYLYYQPSN